MNPSEKWGSFVLAVVALIGFLAFLFVSGYVESSASHGPVFLFRTYPGLMVAMASGFFGATFSMLAQSQTRAAEGTLDDLRHAAAWRTLLVRGCVGLGGAAILYFFFRSGLLEGALWPNLGQVSFESLGTHNVPNKHWCLLIIWSFLAGFSETLVPSILSKTEQKATIS
jgi:hypothetical protein